MDDGGIRREKGKRLYWSARKIDVNHRIKASRE